MLEALNTKAAMIVAGALAVLLLAFGAALFFWYSWALVTICLVNVGAFSVLSWWAIAVKITKSRHAPVVIRDQKDAPARWIDGQVVEHPLYPASLTSLTTHYDPRITTRHESGALPPAEGAPALPGPIDLVQVLHTFRPLPERILLGLAPTGPITCSVKGLSHVALAAPTGGGKSSILRMLAGQLGAIGAHMWLCDPHYTPLDPDSGEDWRPIAAKLAQPPFTKPLHIAHVVSQILGEMRRRYELREHGQRWNGSAYLIIEELPAILSGLERAQAKQFVKDYSDLLRQARKVGIYLVAVAQDWLAETIGQDGGGEIRSNLRTAFFAGGGLATAKAILDQQVKLPDVPLGKGVVLLRNAEAQPAPTLARVPYASNEALYRLLAQPVMPELPMKVAPFSPPAQGPQLPQHTPLSREEKREKEERQRILEMHRLGYPAYVIARKMGKASAYTETVRQVIEEEVSS